MVKNKQSRASFHSPKRDFEQQGILETNDFLGTGY